MSLKKDKIKLNSTSPNILLVLSLVAIAFGPVAFAFVPLKHNAWKILDGFVLIGIGGLVFFHIFPESYAQIGWFAIPIIILSFFGPVFLEKLKSKVALTAHNITLMLALIGILLHEFSDGIALASPQNLMASKALPLAVILHRVPVGMMIWWLLKPTYGTKTVVRIIFLLVITTITGFFCGQKLFSSIDPGWFSIFEAFMGGALLHVLFHSHGYHEHCDHDKNRWQWAAGFGAVLAITGLILFHPAHPHDGAAFLNHKTFLTFVNLALLSAPALVLAYLFSGIMNVFLPQKPIAWLAKGSPLSQSLKGMAFGLPLPICSCGVVPLYRSLVLKGMPLAAGIAFLIATPELSIDALILSVPLLGTKLTGWRLLFSATIAVTVSLLVAKRFQSQSPKFYKDDKQEATLHKTFSQKITQVFQSGFGESFGETAPWILLGLIVAAICAPILEFSQFFESLPDLWEVILFTFLGMPVYVCASGATPLVAVFLANGISPGAALAFLLTGPATNITTFSLLSDLHGKKTALFFAMSMALVAICLGSLLNVFLPSVTVPDFHSHAHSWLLIQQICLGILGFVFLLTLFKKGPRYLIGKIISFSKLDCCH